MPEEERELAAARARRGGDRRISIYPALGRYALSLDRPVQRYEPLLRRALLCCYGGTTCCTRTRMWVQTITIITERRDAGRGNG
jgi:hypothetical protein